jgi:hypothetical protein
MNNESVVEKYMKDPLLRLLPSHQVLSTPSLPFITLIPFISRQCPPPLCLGHDFMLKPHL